MPFETKITVRFGDVDAAGIVFYPRFFEMLNSAVEDWCAEVLKVDFHTLHLVQGRGIPVVDIAASFVTPSVLGDVLNVTIFPVTLGNSSCRLKAVFSCEDEHRLTMELTVVWMDLSVRKSLPWPLELRGRIAACIAEQAA